MAHCAQVDATEQRWKKEYDEGINPFAAFQRSPADATADRTAVATANGWLCGHWCGVRHCSNAQLR
jgi:hypothetical protein